MIGDPYDLLGPADDLAARIEDRLGLSGVSVVVDREVDLDAELAKSVGKAGGALVLVGLARHSAVDERAAGPVIDLRYVVTLWVEPTLAHGAGVLAPTRLLHRVMRAVQGFPVVMSPGYCERFRVGGGQALREAGYWVYAFEASLRWKLVDPPTFARLVTEDGDFLMTEINEFLTVEMAS
jgi:hypothetical protein